uniref:signal peptidase I n=1 Tax=Aegilops tauschii TaxID=37682 RepID=M8AUZ9_AEGTA
MSVLSESMEPAIKKGDMVFVHNMSNEPFREGEVVLFKVDGFEHPIVHRVIKVYEHRDTGEIRILTKGDNNSMDDRFLYASGQLWLQPHDIIGRVAGYLPYAGWPGVFISEAYKLKAPYFLMYIKLVKVDFRSLKTDLMSTLKMSISNQSCV